MFEYDRLLSHGLQGNRLRLFLGVKDDDEEITQGDDENRGL